MVVEDLVNLLNVLVGGTISSGKSSFMQCIICYIIALQAVQDVNLLLIDVSSNDLTIFDGVPHLSHPVVKDIGTAVKIIQSLVTEMEQRITNQKELDNLPFIVCFVDEFPSLAPLIKDKKACESVQQAFSELLKRGRKAKIIMVLAAHDPTKESMQIELANIPTRIGFKCEKPHHSLTILNETGAENLRGAGDMLFKTKEHPNSVRLQGVFPASEFIETLVAKLVSDNCDTTDKFIIPEIDAADYSWAKSLVLEKKPPAIPNPDDKQLCEIIMWVLGQLQISANKIVDTFHISDRRATGFLGCLEKFGIVTEQDSKKPRCVLAHSVQELSDEARTFLTSCGIQIPEPNDIDSESFELFETDDHGNTN
jgi:S-DNA-T family DNA segregation ATPase FtsK/SpoIIIE